ncbi:MAG: hypothetical protein K0Q71_1941, partial [Thermomicrobiales bacterium]|nr:hypothetical protein [Thermomicrobiales bacterium]
MRVSQEDGVSVFQDDPVARSADLAMRDIGDFSRIVLPRYRLRPYQIEPARAVVASVEQKLGRSFAVVFARQAGKDELLAQSLAFLLLRWQERGGSAVVAAPTFRPQAALMRDRLLARLRDPLLAGFGGSTAEPRDGYAVTLGRAAVRFLSAAPEANARGQTADLLLVANEAQDILPDVWDAVFDPMAASTNATTLFLGTVWSRETLLARQMAFLREEEQRDGIHRVWTVPWQEVAKSLPAYGERVRARIAQFGPAHPFIRTEYELQELDGEGGLFPPGRIAAMQGAHPRRHTAEPGKRYALLIDVAGEEEGLAGPAGFRDDTRRDSTAVTVVEVEESRSREVEKKSREPWVVSRGDDGGNVIPARLLDSSTPHLSHRRPPRLDRHPAHGAARAIGASGARGVAGQRGGRRCHRRGGGAGLVPGGDVGGAAGRARHPGRAVRLYREQQERPRLGLDRADRRRPLPGVRRRRRAVDPPVPLATGGDHLH